MIRAVIFDVGGTLVHRTGRMARARWEREHGLGDGALESIWREAVGPGWQGGRTEGEIHARLLAATRVSTGELAGLLEAFDADAFVHPLMADLLKQLRPQYRLATLQNAGPGARATMEHQFGISQMVDVMVISEEEGIAKPNQRIFRIAAERLGVEPATCVFVDDVEENVAAARAIGMTAIRFRTAEAAREVVIALTGTG